MNLFLVLLIVTSVAFNTIELHHIRVQQKLQMLAADQYTSINHGSLQLKLSYNIAALNI